MRDGRVLGGAASAELVALHGKVCFYLVTSILSKTRFSILILFKWLLIWNTGRLGHIASHYETEFLHPFQWSPSFVVKGLLKQFKPEFDVAKPWKKLVGGALNSDREFEWSKKNAEMLQRKLEYREGTPQELAQEALRLAIFPHFEPAPRKSTSPECGEGRRKIWSEATNAGSRHASSSSKQRTDTEMEDLMSSYI